MCVFVSVLFLIFLSCFAILILAFGNWIPCQLYLIKLCPFLDRNGGVFFPLETLIATVNTNCVKTQALCSRRFLYITVFSTLIADNYQKLV